MVTIVIYCKLEVIYVSPPLERQKSKPVRKNYPQVQLPRHSTTELILNEIHPKGTGSVLIPMII